MPQILSNPGYLAAAAFLLFTGTGYAAQVIKLSRRSRAWRTGQLEAAAVCEGLHPVREFWSLIAFLLFALSGMTRSYLDWFLVGSRFPVIILATVVLLFLARFEVGRARQLLIVGLCVDALFLLVSAAMTAGVTLHGTFLSKAVDFSLAGVSFFLFYGKSLQAWTMVKRRQSAAVSWFRELGLILKDATGLWYAVTVGNELFWVALTHVLSTISSSSICIAKFWLERRPVRGHWDRASHLKILCLF